MEINTIQLTGRNNAELETEIKFHIASAKVTNTDLFNLYFNSENVKNIEARRTAISKILKAEKRAGKIQLFLESNRFSNYSTETAYLFNKYPNLSDCSLPANSFIIKI